MAAWKVGQQVRLNYQAMSANNCSYWQRTVGDANGTVSFAFHGAEYRVGFGDGKHGVFPAYMLLPATPTELHENSDKTTQKY